MRVTEIICTRGAEKAMSSASSSEPANGRHFLYQASSASSSSRHSSSSCKWPWACLGFYITCKRGSSLANLHASSFSLAATVFGWWAKKPQLLRKLSTAGRIVPIIFALLSIVLLQLDFTHKSFFLYFAIANAQRECLPPFPVKMRLRSHAHVFYLLTPACSGAKPGGIMHLPPNDIVQIRPDPTATQDVAVDSVRKTTEFDDNVRDQKCNE